MWCEIFSLNQTHYQIETKRRDSLSAKALGFAEQLKRSYRVEEIRKKQQ
jgi:hypothetical protein